MKPVFHYLRVSRATSGIRLCALVFALVLMTGCVSFLTSGLTDVELLDLPQISVETNSVNVRNAESAGEYGDYRKDFLDSLAALAGSRLCASAANTWHIEDIRLSCHPPEEREIRNDTIAILSSLLIPLALFPSHSSFLYEVEYVLTDPLQGVVLKRKARGSTSGFHLGWYFCRVKSARALLNKQGYSVAENAARLILRDITQLAAVSGTEVPSAATVQPAVVPDERTRQSAPQEHAPPPRPLADLPTRRQIALVIGIDKYADHPPLRNAVRDARAVAEVLKDRYGFEVSELYDERATRSGILSAFRDLLDDIYVGNNLLVYYAGHGWVDQKSGEGYWIPVDAVEQWDYVGNAELHKLIGAMQDAQHIFIVADSCFSGSFLTRSDGRGLAVARSGSQPNATANFLQKADNRKSRMVLTSGHLEQVSDSGMGGHSVFAYYFLGALTRPDHQVFTAWELAHRVKQLVSDNSPQRPQMGSLRSAGDENGEMVLGKTRGHAEQR